MYMHMYMHVYMYIPKIELLEHGVDMVFSSQHVTQRGNWYGGGRDGSLYATVTEHGRSTDSD